MSVSAAACPPEVLAGIADLELVARIVVEGWCPACIAVRSTATAPSSANARHYRPGDDLKYVDWKLVARTDRVYTKQFRETTNMASAIVLDTSGSMDFPVAGHAPMTKFRYAVIAAAALAHLISGQGDAVGLLAGDRFLAPRAGAQHLRGLLAAAVVADGRRRLERRRQHPPRVGAAVAARPADRPRRISTTMRSGRWWS